MPEGAPSPGELEWRPIIRLIEALASDASLIEDAVRDVRVAVAEVGRLEAADVARHTRALLAAATRAIADRRGPSQAELDFVEDLAVTRARQRVPIHDVLTAIHVAQRHIWNRARELASRFEVSTDLLMDARDLYEDWAEQVRARLIVAHRRTEIGQAQSQRDRRVQLLRRMLDGGSAAALAAAEAGLDPDGVYWVLRALAGGDTGAAAVEEHLRATPTDLFGVLDDGVTGIVAAVPAVEVDLPVGLAGPLPVEDLDLAHRWAGQARDAAAALGRVGVVDVEDVSAVAALRSRPDLGRRLRRRRLVPLDEEDGYARDIARTVALYLENDRNVDATANALYVHPNTVRHRLKRFVELAGMPLDATFGAVEAWWAIRTWLDERDG